MIAVIVEVLVTEVKVQVIMIVEVLVTAVIVCLVQNDTAVEVQNKMV